MLVVQVAEISEEGLRVDVEDHSWFPDRELARRNDLQAGVLLSRQAGRILVSGSISLTMALECDRCLKEFEQPKKIDFRLAVELEGKDRALALAEHECDQNEMDVLFLEGPVIDIGDILYQQVVLAIPQKTLCTVDCQGLCGNCGADLNREGCGCQADDETPFSVLAQLLKEKK